MKERWKDTVKERRQNGVETVYIFKPDFFNPTKCKAIEKLLQKLSIFIKEMANLQRKDHQYTCIDLFCGMGGFTSGFKTINVSCGVDNCRDAINSFRLNNPKAECIESDTLIM